MTRKRDYTAPRRFPAPWRAFRGVGGYGIEDANGIVLAWVNYSDGTWGRDVPSLAESEAKIIAQAFSELPNLMLDAAQARRFAAAQTTQTNPLLVTTSRRNR